MTGLWPDGAGEFLKGVSQNMKKDIERQQAEQSHFMRLQEVVAAFERDNSQTITKRSELITSFGVKYPGYAHERFANHQSTVWSSVEPCGICNLCGVLWVADVEFTTRYGAVRLGYFQQLRLLLFAWIRLHIHSGPLVAVDSGCAWSFDSGSVLGRNVFDGDF